MSLMSFSKEKFVVLFILMSVVGLITAYFAKKSQIEPTLTGLLIGLSMGITFVVLMWYFSNR